MTHTVLILSLVSLLGTAPARLVSKGALAVYHVDRGALSPPGSAEAVAERLQPIEAQVLAETGRVCRALGMTPPTVDPSMNDACRAAADILSFDTQEASVSEVVRASLEHAGVTDSMTFPFTLRTVAGEAPLADVAALIETHVADRSVTHVGVGIASEPQADGERELTLVFARRMVALGPFPRAVTGGESLMLWGQVPDDTGFPAVLVATPGGEVYDPPVYLGDGMTFWCPLAFQAGSGTYMVEVLAGDRYGPQVTNLFPVNVGVPAPELPVMRLLRPDAPQLGAAALEEQLLALVNRDRKRYGRRPLAPHRGLAAAARAHSADMARRDYFGHRGPVDGPAAERLALRGLRASLVSEAISIAPSTAQAHANLMRSPSHRRTLLEPRMTHIGVGVVIIGLGESRRLVITEELAKLP